MMISIKHYYNSMVWCCLLFIHLSTYAQSCFEHWSSSLICLQTTVNVVIYSFSANEQCMLSVELVNEIHLHKLSMKNWNCHHLNSVNPHIMFIEYSVHCVHYRTFSIILFVIRLIVSTQRKGNWHANKVKCPCIQQYYYCTNWTTIPTEMTAHCNGRRSQRTKEKKRSMWLSFCVTEHRPF